MNQIAASLIDPSGLRLPAIAGFERTGTTLRRDGTIFWRAGHFRIVMARFDRPTAHGTRSAGVTRSSRATTLKENARPQRPRKLTPMRLDRAMTNICKNQQLCQLL